MSAEPELIPTIRFRVVCPNGWVYDEGYAALDMARADAEACDRGHLSFSYPDHRCLGPHRVEQATWSEVER